MKGRLMTLRIRKFLTLFGVIVAASAAIWLLSWFLQFICSLVMAGPTFDIGSRAVNLLAVSTVLATAVIVVAWAILMELDGCLVIVLVVLCTGAVVSAVGWVADHVFVGTPVSADAAQIVYGIVVVIVSLGLSYILFCDDTPDPQPKSTEPNNG